MWHIQTKLEIYLNFWYLIMTIIISTKILAEVVDAMVFG